MRRYLVFETHSSEVHGCLKKCFSSKFVLELQDIFKITPRSGAKLNRAPSPVPTMVATASREDALGTWKRREQDKSVLVSPLRNQLSLVFGDCRDLRAILFFPHSPFTTADELHLPALIPVYSFQPRKDHHCRGPPSASWPGDGHLASSRHLPLQLDRLPPLLQPLTTPRLRRVRHTLCRRARTLDAETVLCRPSTHSPSICKGPRIR